MRLEVLSRQPTSSLRAIPLLFVHGVGHGAWYLTNFLDYFAERGYAAYAPSLRGHGGSEGREQLNRTRIRDYAQDVAQVAAGLSRPPVVIGHSLGGLVVQKYLETQPAAAGILLASLPPTGGLAMSLRLIRRHPREWLLQSRPGKTHAYAGNPAATRDTFFSTDCPDETVNECCRRLEAVSGRVSLEMLGVVRARPERVKVPVLVMGAADDKVITLAEVEATARAYGTEAVIMPGIAHHMALDKGWEAVADRMLAWLDELEAGVLAKVESSL